MHIIIGIIYFNQFYLFSRQHCCIPIRNCTSRSTNKKRKKEKIPSKSTIFTRRRLGFACYTALPESLPLHISFCRADANHSAHRNCSNPKAFKETYAGAHQKNTLFEQKKQEANKVHGHEIAYIVVNPTSSAAPMMARKECRRQQQSGRARGLGLGSAGVSGL